MSTNGWYRLSSISSISLNRDILSGLTILYTELSSSVVLCLFIMVRATGFEPVYTGVKVLCLKPLGYTPIKMERHLVTFQKIYDVFFAFIRDFGVTPIILWMNKEPSFVNVSLIWHVFILRRAIDIPMIDKPL